MRPDSAAAVATGKWRSILTELGMQSKFLTGLHTPCPLCGEEKGQFRFDDKEGRGTYICNSCGAGDGFMLLQRWKSCDFKQAAKDVERLAGVIKVKDKPRVIDATKALREVISVWNGSSPIKIGDQAWSYLTNRGLKLPSMPMSIRLHPALDYWDGEKSHGKFPAMIARVVSPAGLVVTLHRTYLKDGNKAPVPKAKKAMPVAGDSMNGCAIRLAYTGPILGIAEGIETALAAQELYGFPVWSCISSNGMETFDPTGLSVKRIVIFADNDDTFTGQKSAYALAYKLHRKGYQVSVEIPPCSGMDWLDVLLESRT